MTDLPGQRVAFPLRSMTTKFRARRTQGRLPSGDAAGGGTVATRSKTYEQKRCHTHRGVLCVVFCPADVRAQAPHTPHPTFHSATNLHFGFRAIHPSEPAGQPAGSSQRRKIVRHFPEFLFPFEMPFTKWAGHDRDEWSRESFTLKRP